MEKIISIAFFVSSIYFFAEAQYVSGYQDYQTYLIADMLSQFARPMIPVLALMYLLSIMGKRVNAIYFIISLSSAVVFGSVSTTIVAELGFDEAIMFLYMRDHSVELPMRYSQRMHQFYTYVCIYGYQLFFIIQCIINASVIICLCVKTKMKLKELYLFIRGEELEPIHIQGSLLLIIFAASIIKLAIGREFYLEHQSFAAAFGLFRAVLIMFAGVIAFFSNEAAISIPQLRNRPDLSICRKDIDDNLDHNEIDERTMNIIRNLNRLMDEQQIFKDADCKIDDIARMLCSNRTYISIAINKHFGYGFREFITIKRIEYAKTYMLEHTNALQEEVARSSGFADVSTFSKRFRALVGQTPRMWKLNQVTE